MKEKLKQMKKSTLVIIGIAIVAVIAAIVVVIVHFTNTGGKTPNDNNKETQGETAGGDSSKNQTYTVNLKTQGGMVLSEVDVYIYADDTLADVKGFAATDANGSVSFNLAESSSYAIVPSGLPRGYEVKDYYSFDGTAADITLTSSLVKDAEILNATLGVGDVMYDMTVTTSDGEEMTLSEILEEKDMILLNFWYTTCQWCITEFPYMEEAYQMYKDDVEIVALDHLDDTDSIAAFKTSMGLSFPMAQCAGTMPQSVFGISGWPTSVYVDRYGVICLIEEGGISSLTPFVSAFEHFTADDYEQKLYDNIGELVERVKPNVTMDSSEDIEAAINAPGVNITYRPETEDAQAEYIWPFVLGEKEGEKCIYAPNQNINDSYAIIYADVEMKKGQAVGFDYYASCELGTDILYVIVNGDDIYQISGVGDSWEKCYAWVADEDGTYEVALCYRKDSDGAEGDDTVYIKNFRVIDADDIDVATYIPKEAAVTEDGFEYKYADIVYNDKDGYYHVETEDGPLLLADLLGYSQFDEEQSVFENILDNDYTVDGVKIYDEIVNYCNYASNSKLSGVCSVNKELAEVLKKFVDVAGFEDDENEWLRICKYYQVYGTGGEQLENPIRGLAPFCAYEAVLGVDVPTNSFYYDRVIMPRGLFARFVPDKSGAYRITSKVNNQDGVEAWIYNKEGEILYTYEHSERMYEDDKNASMVYYMEAGKEYYINIAFWDLYETGTINYDVEYIGPSFDLFRLASMGYFTYDGDEEGNEVYYIISGGIKAVLGDDGYYHQDLGDGKLGSLIYADFTGITGIFSNSVEQMIDMGGFDFSQSENDAYILAIMKDYNNDVEETRKYLKELWGEDYDFYVGEYKLDDIFAGVYHGEGEDYTSKIKEYLGKADTSGAPERKGCVLVDKELADILQMLMDKYTFENVEQSWLKLCYFYDSIGAK